MREQSRDISFCLMIATTLHSIAVGNLLPAWVRVVCIDINPSTVIKLGDRGSFQTVGLVTDVEPFLRVLTQEVETLESGKPPLRGRIATRTRLIPGTKPLPATYFLSDDHFPRRGSRPQGGHKSPLQTAASAPNNCSVVLIA